MTQEPRQREEVDLGAHVQALEDEIRRLRGQLAAARGSIVEPADEPGFLNGVINAMADPVFVKDASHRWIVLNDAYCAFMGYPRSELIGKSDFDFFPEAEAQVFWDKDDHVMRSGEANVNEESFTDARGVRHVIATKKTVFEDAKGARVLVGVIQDVTEQRLVETELSKYRERLEQLVQERTAALSKANVELKQHMEERRKAEEEKRAIEAQLMRQQKLEAVGRLAGGVAHDFNNLLTGIFGHVSIALKASKPGDRVHDSLTEISGAARRAAALTRQLLAFSSQQMMEAKVVRLDAVVSNLRALLERIIGEDIELQASSQADLGCVRVDPGQIEQVIVNLAVNARDAMPSGGRLSIETTNVTFDAESRPRDVVLAPGEYVKLRVTDTGTGMSPELQKRIFEPFFTTKPVGQGTGLGLSTVYGIVQQHRGAVVVKSAPGQGSSFDVYLPRVVEAQEPEAVPAPPGQLPRGQEVVLLVEDDAMVREVTRVMLQELGYRTLTASRASEALRLCEQGDQRIDLVITDMVMPGMNGRQLVRAICAVRPGVKTLYTSGYAGDIVPSGAGLEQGVEFLSKPYSHEALANKVRGLLDAGRR